LMAPVLTWPIMACAPQTAVWEPPPWAEAPVSAAGRHALAERSEPPTWELQQPESCVPATQEGGSEQADAAVKSAKPRKTAKPKVLPLSFVAVKKAQSAALRDGILSCLSVSS